MSLQTLTSKAVRRIKCISDTPFDILRERRAVELRNLYKNKMQSLPPIPASTLPNPNIEIHMLCNKRDIDMGIWSSWSILRFLPNASLYVHSDGTLDQADHALWQQIIPGVQIISRDKADHAAQSILYPRYPMLRKVREAHVYGLKLCDSHLFGQSPMLLLLDSDVLCFSRPVELEQILSAAHPQFVWNRDIRSSYFAPPFVLRCALGVCVPECLNAGLLALPRFATDDWNCLEKMLTLLETNKLGLFDHFWFEQTMQAICAARFPGSHPLGDSYACVMGATPSSQIMRHYTGIRSNRPRYFTEGIPKLLANINQPSFPHGNVSIEK